MRGFVEKIFVGLFCLSPSSITPSKKPVSLERQRIRSKARLPKLKVQSGMRSIAVHSMSKYTGCVKVENSRRRSALTALLVREAFPLPPLKSNRDRERRSSSWKATGASACARIFYQWRHKSESVWRVGVMLAVLPRRWQKSAKKAKVCWKTRTVSQEHSVCQDGDKCSPSKGIRRVRYNCPCGVLEYSTWIVQAQCVTSAVLREGDSLCFLPDALHCALPYIVLWWCQCLYHNCKALIVLWTVAECLNASCTSHFPLSTNTETPLLHCILVVFALSRN